jgi:hypothetical protein
MKEEKFECPSHGLRLRGHIYGNGDGKKPVAIVCHGFLANESTVEQYAKALAKEGYLALTFDFAGGCIQGSSDGRNEDMTVFTEVSDLESVLDFVHSLEHADCDHIVLMGCSQGGFVSALEAEKHPEHFAGLILFYPAICIPDDARKGSMQMYQFDPNNLPDILGEEPIRLGKEYAASVMDLDVFQILGGFKKPVLYIHGDNDRIVSVDYARKAHRLYEQCEYYEIAGGRHGFKDDEEIFAIRQLKAFAKHLKETF